MERVLLAEQCIMNPKECITFAIQDEGGEKFRLSLWPDQFGHGAMVDFPRPQQRHMFDANHFGGNHQFGRSPASGESEKISLSLSRWSA